MDEIKNTNLSDEELRSILKNVLVSQEPIDKRSRILNTFNFLTSFGWDRKKIYSVLYDIYNYDNNLTERDEDLIGDFLGEIRGEFGSVGLFRLPNEPLDERELYRYIVETFLFPTE